MLFVLSMLTIIVTLMWSIQLFIPLSLSPIVVFLNLWFMFSWIMLTTMYVRKRFSRVYSTRPFDIQKYDNRKQYLLIKI